MVVFTNWTLRNWGPHPVQPVITNFGRCIQEFDDLSFCESLYLGDPVIQAMYIYNIYIYIYI